jgi:hypothetical protein
MDLLRCGSGFYHAAPGREAERLGASLGLGISMFVRNFEPYPKIYLFSKLFV